MDGVVGRGTPRNEGYIIMTLYFTEYNPRNKRLRPENQYLYNLILIYRGHNRDPLTDPDSFQDKRWKRLLSVST